MLDWYRGVGILAVIWGHAGLAGLPGAFVFIDTFFVISGFLVSQSLYRSLARARSGARSGGGKVGAGLVGAVAEFMANRVRRIVIPLCAAVLLTLAAGWFILLPDDLFALATSARATLLLMAHVYALTLGSYFDVVGNSAPLLHAWSLSLEEWFYLITPLAVLPAFVWRKSWWSVGLVFIAALSLLQAQTLSADPMTLGASYSMFTTRLWQFLAGVIAATLLPQPPALPRRINDALILAGLAAVFGSVLVLTDKAPSPGVVTLPAVAGMLCVLVLRPVSAVLIHATGSAVLVYFGRRLYSLYLAHYPVMVFFDYAGVEFGPLTDLVKLGLAVGCGLVFFHLFEAPLRGWRAIGFTKVLGISAGLLLPVVVLSGHVLQSGGAPLRLPDAALAAWTARFDVNPARARCMAGGLTANGYSCAHGPATAPFVALFGDSHSDAIAHQLGLALARQGIGLRHYWYAECPVIGSGQERLGVFSPACDRLSHEAHRAALRDPGLVGVVYAARWPWYLADPDAATRRAYWRDASGLPRGHAAMGRFRQEFIAILGQSAQQFQARQVPVHVLTPVPRLAVDPVRALVLDRWQGWGWQRDALAAGLEPEARQRDQAVFDAAFAPLVQAGSLRLVDVDAALCDGSGCKAEGLYYDDSHLNEAGAALVVEKIVTSGDLRVRPSGAP